MDTIDWNLLSKTSSSNNSDDIIDMFTETYDQAFHFKK